jgi:hypothetical protein
VTNQQVVDHPFLAATYGTATSPGSGDGAGRATAGELAGADRTAADGVLDDVIMRLVTIMTIAALAATSACGSSNGHSGGSAAAVPAKSPGATASTPAPTADIPGFSGPVEPSSGKVTHLYGRCLHSWYTKASSGTNVHVEYPGQATVSVDLTITDESEPPPEAHQQFTLAQGKRVRDLRFPAIPHAGYPQITVTAGQQTMTCEAPAKR